jgi:hypothetical protein
MALRGFWRGGCLNSLLAFANSTGVVEKPRQAEGGKVSMLARSVKSIRVWAITVVGAIVVRAIVVGAIVVRVPKEVKAQVAKAVVVVVMVAMPVGTLRHAMPMLQRLPLEMSLLDMRSQTPAVASVTATVCPDWGWPHHGRHQTEHQHATGKSPEYSPVLPCHGLYSFSEVFSSVLKRTRRG